MTVQAGERWRRGGPSGRLRAPSTSSWPTPRRAHRAQGRTVDTAHAMVSSTTTREVLYVSGTRGREGNWLYVDTHYDPDPQTSHDQATEPVTAKEVLAGVLRNEGADVAAHDMIRREQAEAEGMERLSAEYLTLATDAQARTLGRLARALRAHASRPRRRPCQRGARSAARGIPRGRSPRPGRRGGLPATGRRPVPGRRRSTWPRCCTVGWIVGPRRPVAGAGGADDLIAGLIPRVTRGQRSGDGPRTDRA